MSEAMANELQAARDRIAELEKLMGSDVTAGLIGLGMTRLQSRLLVALLKRPGVTSREQLLEFAYSDRWASERPELKIIDIHLHHARKKLREHGIEITTHWGSGFSLNQPNKEKLRKLLTSLDAEEGKA